MYILYVKDLQEDAMIYQSYSIFLAKYFDYVSTFLLAESKTK